MNIHNIRLIKREIIADETAELHFEKPREFHYKAGQAVDITLIDPPETDDKGNTRAFSLTSAPFENELAVATRLRSSAFKRVMKNMAAGTAVRLSDPFGAFTLHNDSSRPAVFLAGGIGITPFMSIIKQACHDDLPYRLFLFYSNRRPEDAAFLVELSELEQAKPNFRHIAIMTQMGKSRQEWNGETARLGFERLKKVLNEEDHPVYYSAGPASMVAAMRRMLNDAGVNDDDIRTEDFSGY